MHDLNPIVRRHKINPKWGICYKMNHWPVILESVQITRVSPRLRKYPGLQEPKGHDDRMKHDLDLKSFATKDITGI